MKTAALLLIAAIIVGGCATEDPGIDPNTDRFYFPIGLTLDPQGDFLFISNSNSDLRFNGGTITALDLSALPGDLTQIGAAVKAGSLDCAPARTDTTSWECKESQFILPSSTIRIGDFPSALQVSSDGKRLFAGVRGEQSYLLWADITHYKENVGKTVERVDLSCNDDCDPGRARDCDQWDCDAKHMISRSEELLKDLPREPFGILLNELAAVHVNATGERATCHDGRTSDKGCGRSTDCPTGYRCDRNAGRCSAVSCSCGAAKPCTGAAATDCCVAAPGKDHVYMAHLSGGDVSFFTSEKTRVVLRDMRAGFFTASGGIGGGYDLAAQLPGDADGRVYVSSRVDNVLGSFVIRNHQWIVDSARASVQAVYPATDVRGLAFAPGGSELYLSNRLPASLVALDMRIKEGLPRQESLWAQEVCTDPSRVRLGRGPDGTLLAYVACFSGGQIYVVDTVRNAVIGQVATGKGPYDLVLDTGNKRAFVTNFLENTVGVIDLDATHVSYLKMVARIGLAENLLKD